MEATRAQRELTDLYESEVDHVFGYVRHRVGADDAADIVSEVFHAAALSYRDGVAVTPSWLMAVANNKVMDHWRRAYRRKAKQHLTHRRSDEMTEFPRDWAADPRRADVVAALDRLPDHERSLLLLHHVDGLAISELADLLGKSDRAVESALARARRRFRTWYEAVAQ